MFKIIYNYIFFFIFDLLSSQTYHLGKHRYRLRDRIRLVHHDHLDYLNHLDHLEHLHHQLGHYF